ncbi:MAG TPA: glycosyltransferase [Fimbriimonadaceae bacterium]|nr:glycosyltransferase [Fimbriimonadaceae bacterium]
MKIVLSFNKPGWEGDQWTAEIERASDEHTQWIAFNHQEPVPIREMLSFDSLDRLWKRQDPRLLELYRRAQKCLDDHQADVLFVTNCPPYHPDWLAQQKVHRVLWSTDDPGSTDVRTIPYLGSYDQVFYLNPEFDAERSMAERLAQAGMTRSAWLPHGYMPWDVGPTGQDRDLDLVYVGHCFAQKLPALRAFEKAFGDRLTLRGHWKLKHNLYSWVFGGPRGWVKPVSFSERAEIHARAKIGINLHWNEHGVGNQRLYYLPANGVLQICDGPKAAGEIFRLNEEIVACSSVSEMIDAARYYLDHPNEARPIAEAGRRRAEAEYSFTQVLRRAARLIDRGGSP